MAELLDAGATYYTAVQTIIPIAATSEIVLTSYYDSLRPAGRRPAGLDAAARLRQRTDPGGAIALGPGALGTRAARAGGLADGDVGGRHRPRSRVGGTGELTPAAAISGAEDFAQRFATHLDTFGHAVYNLDFANPVPADDPAPLVDVVRLYLSRQAGRPVRAAAAVCSRSATRPRW